MSLIDKASIIWNQGAPSKAGFVAAWNPQTQALVNFPVTRATTKTRVNEAGIIESVAANVLPRDFTNGGCGDFAIEPQRTNLILRSEEIENAIWTKTASGTGVAPIVTANTGVSPDGTTTADRVQFDTGAGGALSDFSILQQAYLQTSGESYAYTIWLKSNTGATQNIQLRVDSALPEAAITITNEWQRFTILFTGGTTASRNVGLDLRGNVAVSADLLVWGAQLEIGTYATSYIPTVASAVTRNADVPALTGASALLGDSEGALFVEAAVFETSTSKRISLSDGSTTNRILLGLAANSSLLVSNASGTQADIGGSTLTSNVFFKVLIRYANNNFAIHQGGIEIGTDTSGTTFTDGLLNTIRLASGTGSSAQFYGRIRQLVVFNQSPTSAQANSITTP